MTSDAGDPLARLAHRLWTHWSSHIASEEDISQERLDRWQQYWVPYDDLPDDVKQTDRDLVDRFVDQKPPYDDL